MSGSADGGGVSPTGDNTPTFSGVAEAGSTVGLSAGGQSLGQVVVEGSGNLLPGIALRDEVGR